MRFYYNKIELLVINMKNKMEPITD